LLVEGCGTSGFPERFNGIRSQDLSMNDCSDMVQATSSSTATNSSSSTHGASAKSHLRVGLGLKTIEPGYRVRFTTAATMIAGDFRSRSPGDSETILVPEHSTAIGVLNNG